MPLDLKNINNQLNKIQNQLKDNETKTITENKSIINIDDNVGGIANIVLEGNTVDICKDPIVSDFQGKTQGDIVINPNVAKYNFDKFLLIPANFGHNELQNHYDLISRQDNSCSQVVVTGTSEHNGLIPQQLFSFDLVKKVERKLGISIGNNITEKVAWLKKNVTKIACNWWGYGVCSSGNKAYLDAYFISGNEWVFNSNSTKNNVSHNKSSIDNLRIVHNYPNNWIDTDGFVHYIAYTDASDGKTASTIYTDYVNIEVQLSPILKSVGEEENNKIEIKSVGKNLCPTDSSYWEQGSINIFGEKENSNSRIRTKEYIHIMPNTEYKIYLQNNFSLVVRAYDINKNFIRNIGIVTNNLTTQMNEYYIKIMITIDEIKNIIPSDVINAKPIMSFSATQSEDYKEDKTAIQLKEPLRGLPNGTRDTINTDGTITRRVGKMILSGKEEWKIGRGQNQNSTLYLTLSLYKVFKPISPNLMPSMLINNFPLENYNNIYHKEVEGICIGDDGLLKMRINKSKLSTNTTEGLKKWLKENPVTVYYELAEPTTERIGQPLSLQTFKGGNIQTSTNVAPYLTIKYPSNLNSRVSNIEEANNFMNDSLGGAWRVLLMLADKDLKMKSIQPLTSTDIISKKINEIIGVW